MESMSVRNLAPELGAGRELAALRRPRGRRPDQPWLLRSSASASKTWGHSARHPRPPPPWGKYSEGGTTLLIDAACDTRPGPGRFPGPGWPSARTLPAPRAAARRAPSPRLSSTTAARAVAELARGALPADAQAYRQTPLSLPAPPTTPTPPPPPPPSPAPPPPPPPPFSGPPGAPGPPPPPSY